jgi:ATP-binding cassette subfamily B protein
LTASLAHVSWPLSELGGALEALARRSGFAPSNAAPAVPRGFAAGGLETIGQWLDAAAAWLGVEVEAVATTYATLGETLERSAPSIWTLPDPRGNPRAFVAVLGSKEGRLRVLAPNGATTLVLTDDVRRALTAPIDAAVTSRIDEILRATGAPPARQARARQTLLVERYGNESIEGTWLVRPHPGRSFFRDALRARVHFAGLRLVVAHALSYGIMIASWWALGRGALSGRFDPGWLLLWGLLALTTVPLRLVSSWAESLLSLKISTLLKQRLLYGTFRLDPDRIRHEGSGELLGRVVESEAIESLATSGGLSVVTGLVEVFAVAFVLASGPMAKIELPLFAVWIGLVLLATRRFFLARRAWTDERLARTRDLVERMMGHRTRLAQEAPERWHDGEDAAVERYVTKGHAMDRASLVVSTLLGRGWLVAGFVALLGAFVDPSVSAASMAVGIGGVLLADRALQKLTAACLAIGDAAIAWRSVGPVFRAASEVEPAGVPALAVAAPASHSHARAPIVESRALVYRHPGRAEPVLRGCDLTVRAGDRILLEGSSGSGKSTFAGVLTGLRAPESGLLLLDGLDRRTLGAAAWRRRVVSAPQFHENHVLSGTFAYNVLMGRAWPADEALLSEAEAVCREIGLGPLLDRMPAGMLQVVGDTGWQLSHGERSRLFLARAIMQQGDVLVLDESFAALDPENLERALRCVLARAKTLMVIAHP